MTSSAVGPVAVHPIAFSPKIEFTCTGRLEDKAAIVRKCALQLLSKLLCFNPFGQYLPLDPLVASLNQYKDKLQVRFPRPCQCSHISTPTPIGHTLILASQAILVLLHLAMTQVTKM